MTVVEELETQPTVDRETITHPDQYANYIMTVNCEKKQLEVALEDERSRVLALKVENKQLERQVKKMRMKSGSDCHRRAWSAAHDRCVETDLCQMRRRSFAKNLGIAWENMQSLKEASAHIYAQFDQYFAQLQ